MNEICLTVRYTPQRPSHENQPIHRLLDITVTETLSFHMHSAQLYNGLAHRDLEVLHKGSKGKVFERCPIFLDPTLLFPIACIQVDPFLECVMGFATVNMIKTDTLCNENNYGTEKQREQENV